MEQRRAGEGGTDYRSIRRSWRLGDEVFRKKLLEQMRDRVGENCLAVAGREDDDAQVPSGGIADGGLGPVCQICYPYTGASERQRDEP